MFELINGNVIVSTALPGGWCDLPDGSRASPTQDGWSNDECRLAEIQGADAASEGRQVASTSGEVVDGRPRNVHVLEDATGRSHQPTPPIGPGRSRPAV